MLKSVVSAFILACLLMSPGTPHPLVDFYLGQNLLAVPITDTSNPKMNRAVFDAALDQVEKVYAPIFASLGKTLVIRRNWESEIVDAVAYEGPAGESIVEMYGGLARSQSVTGDSLALVACHEIGHHIGGAPFYDENPIAVFNRGRQFPHASTEGQSDYFATLKCLRLVFEKDRNTEIVRSQNMDPLAIQRCSAAFANPEAAALCTRSVQAALDLSAITEKARLNTPSSITQVDLFGVPFHPAEQCRLDTYLAGAVCGRDARDPVGEDPKQGVCNWTKQSSFGARPLCWYGAFHQLYEEKEAQELKARIQEEARRIQEEAKRLAAEKRRLEDLFRRWFP